MKPLHQSRTTGGKMKIREIKSGLTFVRHPPDATAMVVAGGFEFVDRDTPSIGETLADLPLADLESLAAAGGVRFSGEQRTWIIGKLVPKIEAGGVNLP